MIFALLNLLAVAEGRTVVQDKITVMFNKLLGKYLYTNIERAKDTTTHSAKEMFYRLNWQRIGYLFIFTVFLARIPFLINFMTKNREGVAKQTSKFADNKKHIALMVVLGLATFEGLYLVDKLNPAWARIMDPANDIIGYIGLAIGAIALGNMFYLHNNLGDSWAATVSVQKDHQLKLRGPYGYARHPMYLNFLLHPLAVLLITQNWLLTAVFTPWVLYAVSRIKREERMLIDQFGASYVDYMNKVPALGPLDKLFGHNLGLSKSEAQKVLNIRVPTAEKKEVSTGKK